MQFFKRRNNDPYQTYFYATVPSVGLFLWTNEVILLKIWQQYNGNIRNSACETLQFSTTKGINIFVLSSNKTRENVGMK
jgi:hypothetical protein